MAHLIYTDFREPAAAEAYNIALDYLWRSGAVRNEFETYQFLSYQISQMVDRGQTNKLRMANKAISDYQRRYAATYDGWTPCG